MMGVNHSLVNLVACACVYSMHGNLWTACGRAGVTTVCLKCGVMSNKWLGLLSSNPLAYYIRCLRLLIGRSCQSKASPEQSERASWIQSMD